MQQDLELFRDYTWSTFANAWQHVSFAGDIACTEVTFHLQIGNYRPSFEDWPEAQGRAIYLLRQSVDASG